MRKLGGILLGLSLMYVNIASAKVWLLPDYQREQFYSHRVNGDDKADGSEIEEEFSCSDYFGLLPLSAIGGDIICSEYFYGPQTCCQNWICNPSSFPYTAELCRSEGKIPAEPSCTNKDGTLKYQRCKCDTSKYPHILSTCEHILSGASCEDEDGVHFEDCRIDPCKLAEDEGLCLSCDYQCQTYHEDCDSCCVECKPCVRRDCTSEGYVREKSPALIYDENDICYMSCEDSTPYYKAIGCAIGYYDVSNYWCEECGGGCPRGYYNPRTYWCGCN